jgi:hypothetical protein
VKKFLQYGEEKFFEELYEKVGESIRGMRGYKYNWPTALDTNIFSVLAREIGGVGIYDQKYLVCERTKAGWKHNPVIPAVHAAYRHWLWSEIMDYVAREERILLQFCCFRGTSDEACGRMFKHVVIQRIKSSGLEFQWKKATITILSRYCVQFAGSRLPSAGDMHADVFYIPDSPTFSGVDFFVKSGSILVGFQAHVWNHQGVSWMFWDRCYRAGWFVDSITDVVLIFLCPDHVTKQGVADWIPSQYAAMGKYNIGKIHLMAWSCLDDFIGSCLGAIPWPTESYLALSI